MLKRGNEMKQNMQHTNPLPPLPKQFHSAFHTPVRRLPPPRGVDGAVGVVLEQVQLARGAVEEDQAQLVGGVVAEEAQRGEGRRRRRGRRGGRGEGLVVVVVVVVVVKEEVVMVVVGHVGWVGRGKVEVGLRWVWRRRDGRR